MARKQPSHDGGHKQGKNSLPKQTSKRNKVQESCSRSLGLDWQNGENSISRNERAQDGEKYLPEGQLEKVGIMRGPENLFQNGMRAEAMSGNF